MFGKIFPFLCAGLVLWYLILILWDIYKGKLADKNSATPSEDEIDISDDVNEFAPVKIEKNPTPVSPDDDSHSDDVPEYVYEDKTSLLDMDMETLLENLGTIDEAILRQRNINQTTLHRQVITDGIDSEEFCARIKQSGEGKKSILSDILHQWEKAV